MATDERQTRRALMGALLIAALITFAVLIFFLDDMRALLTRRYEIVAIVPAAPGLVRGSPVWLAGKEVGTVQQVALLPIHDDTTARVALTLELPRDLRRHVRTDSRVRLASERTIGTRVVDIVPGTPQASVLQPGDTLRLAQLITPDMLSARARTVKSALDTMLVTIREISPVLSARLQQTQRAFEALDPGLREAEQLRIALQTGEGIQALRDPAFAAALERALATAAALPPAFAQLRQRGTEAAEVRLALARLQARADSVRLQLATATNLLGTGNGSLSRFQRDSALIHAIARARTDLDSLIAEARRQPWRFVF